MTDIFDKSYRVPCVRGTRGVFHKPSVICHPSHLRRGIRREPYYVWTLAFEL